MTRIAARGEVSMLCACALLLSGCETTTAPVSERQVGDYQRNSKVIEAQTKPKAAAEPSAVAPATRSDALEHSHLHGEASRGWVGISGAEGGQVSRSAPASPSIPGPSPSRSSATAAPKSAAKVATDSTAVGDAAAEGDWRPESYVVKRGDTLYLIALDHGLDYKDLASWNQLQDANLIKVGQQLRLRPPPGWTAEPAEPDGVIARPIASEPLIQSQPLEAPAPLALKSTPKGIKAPYSEQALAQLTRESGKAPLPETKVAAPEPKPDARPVLPTGSPTTVPTAAPVPAKATTASPPLPTAALPTPTPSNAEEKSDVIEAQEPIQWVWPTVGRLLHTFNQGPNPKGVAIGGNTGQPVLASAAGKVVYSGNGLRGYGKLIIIKHNNTYLSVYAHNRELLVKEGERVSKGQRIAEMGSIDSERVGLHFEIRRLGKPVDPLKYLPQEGA